ncbi:chromate transporter [Paenibacillus sp. FSL A5-0031]|uniref:chromate transporter n=1 Tax=Paenibacillus sp. FSL A5-0031 TaxID=1920420 RepID=UPI00096E9B3C|nr:chromate transporter [Paenibacillus sp. FSL A5-0031]OME79495.1 chromate transporter [Paenibacillus sp. FSL A5-0031]
MKLFFAHFGKLNQLFWTFFKIGPSSFGGGFAMMPIIEREVVIKRQWFTEDEMADMLSMAGMAPGGVAVNAAAFVGYRKAGVIGAVAAIAGVTLPTFLIVIILSFVYLFLRDEPKVQAALRGIHAAVIALILMAAYRMAKVSVFDVSTTCVTTIALLSLLLLSINPLYVILLGLVVGLVIVKSKEWIGLEVRTERMDINAKSLREPEYFI